MTKPKLIVGYGEDGKTPVMNGGFLLYMKDTIGLDIGITIELLEEMGWAFDVISYFTACHLNPNYSFDKSLSMLISNAPVDLHTSIQVAVGYFLDHKEDYIKKYANQDFSK